MLFLIKKLRLRVSNERGFTLIELMIVVIIIGLLAATVVPNYLATVDEARKGRAVAEMRSIQTALDIIHTQNPDIDWKDWVGEDLWADDSLEDLKKYGITEDMKKDPWDNDYKFDAGEGKIYKQK